MKLKRQKTGRACGLTLIEVLVVVVCLVLLAAVLLPAIAKAKWKGREAWCTNYLKQIGLACRIWEGDHNDKYPMRVSTNEGGSMEWGAGINTFRHFQVMSNQFHTPYILSCLADTRKRAEDFAAFSNGNLSYFINLDADETMPAMPLAGDRNLVTNGFAVSTGLTTVTSNVSLSWSTGIHNNLGNIGLADGSVRRVGNSSLQQLFLQTGTNMTRLAVP